MSCEWVIMLQLTLFLLTVNQQQLCYEHKDSNQSSPKLSSAYLNGGSALNTNISSSVDFSTHSRRVDPSPNMLSLQATSLPSMQGMIKSETAYSNCAPYIYGGEAQSTVGDASVASFSNDSSIQSLNDPLVDADASTFGFLGQIPRNFSLSDLTADFSQSSGLVFIYALPFSFAHLVSRHLCLNSHSSCSFGIENLGFIVCFSVTCLSNVNTRDSGELR